MSTNVYSLGYDRAGQLLDAVLRQAGPAGAIVKRHAYAYDAAGNRTGEQIDAHPAAEVPNALNQLVSRSGGGPVRFAGGLSETGAVSVAGMAAVMSGGTNFSGGAVVGIGTNLVSVTAVDENGNAATNVYSLVVTNSVKNSRANQCSARACKNEWALESVGFPARQDGGPRWCCPLREGRLGYERDTRK